nr:PASTA domain-containing protein [Saprospiraceae bacterium]
ILLEGGRVPMEMKRRFVDFEKVPDVIGMGARDASYLMERCGLRVRIEGAGKVVQQSLRPGINARGQMVQLKLG